MGAISVDCCLILTMHMDAELTPNAMLNSSKSHLSDHCDAFGLVIAATSTVCNAAKKSIRAFKDSGARYLTQIGLYRIKRKQY
ncbi:hypothetical protein ACLOJK_019564 [Asimina triloba]